MPNKKNNSKRRKNRKRSGKAKSQTGPPTGATSYFGGLLAPRNLLKKSEPLMVWLRAFNTITSTAGGVLSPVYSNTDPRSLALDFASYAGIYQEYRVLGVHVAFTPVLMYASNNVLITGQPFSIGTIRDNVSSPSSYNGVAGLADCRLRSSNTPWRAECRAVQSTEMSFIPVATDPTSTFSIRIFASGFAANTIYGSTLVTYAIQFLNRV
jgi:hypothetical protein